MRLPWVAREQLELVAAQRDAAWDRYADLLEKYHMLRLAGFHPPAQPLPKAPRNVILEAITERAGTDIRLRHAMIGQANEDKAAGLSDEEIAFRIHRGLSADDVIEAGMIQT